MIQRAVISSAAALQLDRKTGDYKPPYLLGRKQIALVTHVEPEAARATRLVARFHPLDVAATDATPESVL